eukprot:CAMPEP_0119557256 /NCGR_PEP_ID=MMETSP1352-20130426/8986_1 /TAXON_ID=265584 /ORGANISM="Stauroneis constricta, Strain CCMP1120" /LENGTH=54 /DNA_ID=CAMNT_0007604337 /DNA_START=60 /DNA_END=224 /DNA_ORIENTATION=+
MMRGVRTYDTVATSVSGKMRKLYTSMICLALAGTSTTVFAVEEIRLRRPPGVLM